MNAQSFEIKSNPIGFAFGATNLSVETPVTADGTTTWNVSAWHYSEELRDWVYTDRKGGLSTGVRKYVNGRGDEGFFMGMAARYVFAKGTTYEYNPVTGSYEYGYDKRKNYGSLGFTVGYKFVFNDKLTIDTFGGIGRILFSDPSSYGSPAELMGGINFGYRF
ncbi:MAG: hypothetical protein RLZZ599_854 [Bacteroidota bacterium]